jgi:hypothetical protein
MPLSLKISFTAYIFAIIIDGRASAYMTQKQRGLKNVAEPQFHCRQGCSTMHYRAIQGGAHVSSLSLFFKPFIAERVQRESKKKP